MSAFVVGLTGGIGSGKSTVADAFVALGAGLVDTDAIAHALTAAGGAAMPALIEQFGPAVADARGALDRQSMRERVFADPVARSQLEQILHPMIRQRADLQCAADPAPYVILAVPLLVESGAWRTRCDRVLVVDCSEARQVERVMARNGLDAASVRAIMAAQASRSARLAVADDVLHNDGALTELRDSIAGLHARYLQLQAEKLKASC